MHKTWICAIYGGGTPTYLVSAKSEKRAWELIREALFQKYGGWSCLYSRNQTAGLIEIPWWHADGERIDDIHDLYCNGARMKKGSFEGFKGYD